MKKKNFIPVFVAVVAMGMVMAGCTAEEDGSADGKVYKYTEAQLQEIADLQEEYGVTLTSFVKESDEPLPTMEDMQNLIAQVAELQSAFKNATRRTDESVAFSNVRKGVHPLMTDSGIETYSGKKSGDFDSRYGRYSFTIKWSGLDFTRGNGSVTLEHDEDADYPWRIILKHWEYHLEGGYGIRIKLDYVVKKVNSDDVQATFNYKEIISVALGI